MRGRSAGPYLQAFYKLAMARFANDSFFCGRFVGLCKYSSYF
ncbi:hypothetical protein MRBBS_2489 [Marinobacter sp. BSs20148]|nr:hypothetical protein MRBBS_2489 [Marinobacter sp. BSs20148]